MTAYDPKFVVLMTACIAPKAGTREGLRRSDPAVRLADYKWALEFWLTIKSDQIVGIVFAENSGYPLDELKELAARCARKVRDVEFRPRRRGSTMDIQNLP
jgi:hypothetical protein